MKKLLSLMLVLCMLLSVLPMGAFAVNGETVKGESVVVDANGAIVNVSDDITFTAEVTLTNAAGNPVSGTFESSKGTLTVPASGKFTVSLTDGASFVVRGIPEMTRYTV